jgi:hypothetical protein
MNAALIPPNPDHLNNKIFYKKYHRDNGNVFFQNLKDSLLTKGISLNTIDFYDNEKKIDFVLFFRLENQVSFIKNILLRNNNTKFIYFAMEPPNIAKTHTFYFLKNWKFDRIFTWNDDLIIGDITKTLFYSQDLDFVNVSFKQFKQKKRKIAAIFSYKKSNNTKSNYTQRINLIKKLASYNLIDLYGYGWENCEDPIIRKIYKGQAVSKSDVLNRYMFCLAMENSCYKNYITEKILDPISIGSFPIYFGAPNIYEFFSKNLVMNSINSDEIELFINNFNDQSIEEFLISRNSYILDFKNSHFNAKKQTDYIADELIVLKNKVKRNKMHLIKIFVTSLRVRSILEIKRYYWELLITILKIK